MSKKKGKSNTVRCEVRDAAGGIDRGRSSVKRFPPKGSSESVDRVTDDTDKVSSVVDGSLDSALGVSDVVSEPAVAELRSTDETEMVEIEVIIQEEPDWSVWSEWFDWITWSEDSEWFDWPVGTEPSLGSAWVLEPVGVTVEAQSDEDWLKKQKSSLDGHAYPFEPGGFMDGGLGEPLDSVEGPESGVPTGVSTSVENESPAAGTPSKGEKGKSRKSSSSSKPMSLAGLLSFIACMLLCVSFILMALPAVFDTATSISDFDTGTISYNDFMTDLHEGDIDAVYVVKTSPFYTVVYKEGRGLEPVYDEVTGEVLELNLNKDGVRVERVLNPDDPDFAKTIAATGVTVGYSKESRADSWEMASDWMMSLGFYVLIAAIFVRLFGGGASFSTSISGSLPEAQKSKGKGKSGDEADATPSLDDVAGLEAEKAEFLFTVRTLIDPEYASVSKLSPTKGILLEGPPGTGKTMLTRAVAKDSGMNFVFCSGSDFSGMFVSQGSSRVKSIFREARAKAPCILFIDEFDALGKSRSSRATDMSRDDNNTMATLLTEMDGIAPLTGVLVVAATNRVSDLDPAVLRPGRFDKTIHIDIPRAKSDIEAIVRVHMKDRVFDEDATVERLVSICYGLSGAEIAYVLNDAVGESLRRGAKGVISLKDVSAALNKRLTGGVQKNTIEDKDLFRVAVHEAGHAVMNLHLGRAVPEVSIQGYSSGVGGLTRVDAESANLLGLRTRTELLNDVKVLYAGRIAEELVLGEASIGASNDLEKATQVLLQLNGVYGLSGSLVSQSVLDKLYPMRDPETDGIDALAKELYAESVQILKGVDLLGKINCLATRLLEERTVFGPTLDELVPVGNVDSTESV